MLTQSLTEAALRETRTKSISVPSVKKLHLIKRSCDDGGFISGICAEAEAWLIIRFVSGSDLSERPEFLLVRGDAAAMSDVRGRIQRGGRGGTAGRRRRSAGGSLPVRSDYGGHGQRRHHVVGAVRLSDGGSKRRVHAERSTLLRRAAEIRRTSVQQPRLRLPGQYIRSGAMV